MKHIRGLYNERKDVIDLYQERRAEKNGIVQREVGVSRSNIEVEPHPDVSSGFLARFENPILSAFNAGSVQSLSSSSSEAEDSISRFVQNNRQTTSNTVTGGNNESSSSSSSSPGTGGRRGDSPAAVMRKSCDFIYFSNVGDD